MTQHLLGSLSIALFTACFALQLRAFISRSPVARNKLLVLAIAATVLQDVTVWKILFQPAGVDLGLISILALVASITTTFIVVSALRFPIANLLLIACPLAVGTLTAATFANSTVDLHTDLSAGLIAHLIGSIAAYCLLAMAAAQSAALWLQERFIREKRSIALIRFLPPLITMERLLFVMLWLGTGVLTIAILSGFLFLDNMFDQRVVHHTILTSIAWLAYVTLLIGRHVLGWRSTTAIVWSLSAFGLLVVGYLGSKFVIEVLLA
ncbi:MAG: cytochrome c biogenesis protein CcsA [Pseudomonadaceae bacterium]|nr:cytochrome c biogenesis protein CcsA [Pseudomonadaceae bacterium]